MAVILGEKYTGSMTFTSGQTGQNRWIYCNDQVARTLAIQASGPSLPTGDNLIKTDKLQFSGLALHIKTVKTVSNQSDMLFTTREIYAWGGSNEDAHVRYSYDGIGSFGAVYINEGAQANYDRIANMQANKIVVDNSQANTTVDTWIKLQSTQNSPLSIPLGFVGVHLQLVDATGGSGITTTNTWTFEIRYCYWV